MTTKTILVVGSVNLDLVATGPRLPRPGETVTGATFAQHPGGKGANQALAARRLGCHVRLAARVGRDASSDSALSMLRAAGVDLSGLRYDSSNSTGVALIAVAATGENQIIVAAGANALLAPADLPGLQADAIICQLEVPATTVDFVMQTAQGFRAVNLAPALAVPESVLMRAHLLVVNDTEAAFYGAALHRSAALVAVTHGAAGATLWQSGQCIASAASPSVHSIDTTGAGDAFVAALTLALTEGQPPAQALRFACTAGALATTRAGAQPSLPSRDDIELRLRGV